MRILILGISNILLTDEAIGVCIIEALERRYILPDFADALDGGTTGTELLGDVANRDHLIVADVIVSKENTLGTMMILRNEEIPALFTNKISPHQLGLADMLSTLRFTDEFPKELTLIGVIPESLEPHIGLTPAVEAMTKPTLEQVLATLHRSGVEAIPREAAHVWGVCWFSDGPEDAGSGSVWRGCPAFDARPLFLTSEHAGVCL